MCGCSHVKTQSTNARQHLTQQLYLQLVVVDNKYSKAGSRCIVDCRAGVGWGQATILHTLLYHFYRNCYDKLGSPTLLRVNPYTAIKQLHNLAGYRQSKPHTLLTLRTGQTCKGIEYTLLLVVGHSTSCISHTYNQSVAIKY